MEIIRKSMSKLSRGQKGQDLAEYAMLIGLIAILVVVTVTLLGTQISATFNGIAMEIGGWGIGG
jgi:pilus assembly protein Flp/PilA